MKHSFLKKSVIFAFSLSALLLPLAANAEGASQSTGWLSNIFNWQKNLSGLFETRKDSVESNSIARDQLLNWRRGTISIDASTTNEGSLSAVDSLASSSPVFITYGLFEEKKAALVTELMATENSLRSDASALSGLIADKAAKGSDMSAANASLTEADADIDAAHSAIADFESYEQDAASSSGLVDLEVPQSYLTKAVAAIRTAKAALKSTIALIGDSR